MLRELAQLVLHTSIVGFILVMAYVFSEIRKEP